MAEVLLKGQKIRTSGKLPKVGSRAPDFRLTRGDLSDVSLKDFAGKAGIKSALPQNLTLREAMDRSLGSGCWTRPSRAAPRCSSGFIATPADA